MSSDSALPRPRSRIRSRNPSQGPSAAASVVLTAEDRSLLGPAPVTIFEDAARYEQVLSHLVAAVGPQDFIELVWVKDVADLIWEGDRLKRAKSVSIAVAQEEALKWVVEVSGATGASGARDMSGGVGALVADYLSASLSMASSDPQASADLSAMAKAPVLLALSKLGLSEREIGDAALVQALGAVERLDRLILISSRRRDAIIRDLERRRADLAARLARAVAQATTDGSES